MSDEPAFLNALQANPADDTARLVYADWLDEHGEPAKAEYLRAVVALTRHNGGTPEYTDAAVSLYSVVSRTDTTWRNACGGRFELLLAGFEPMHKIITIKTLRLLTGFGLAEAKALSESVPTSIFSWMPFEKLLPSLLKFRAALNPRIPDGIGITAEIRPTPWPSDGGRDILFEVRLVKCNDDFSEVEQHDNFPPERSYVAQCVARLLAITPDEAVDRLRSLPLTLHPGVSPRKLADFVREIKMGMNVNDPLPPDAIQIIPRPIT